MAKKSMDDLLKRRMSATQHASELQTSDEAYEKLFRETPPAANARVCDIPLDKLTPFFTADIGFRSYTPAQLEAFAGWREIPAEVVEADDARAIVIATSTNLIQRQNLSIIERGKAYKALLEAKSRQGQRFDLMRRATSGDNRPMLAEETLGENHQRYSARALVAEFFGVTEYEIRKAVKLTQLIP